ncbi:major facilitator superfamily domain-containing protein [Yarrowia lipolytica]|uniref:Major facilitator superfamily domain-containing protein n=1 Tax=Yarrowia lipolytica TaxID=4952 RepID=A0A371CG32_YARLL|nr:major facilitator superfamily domain-containing protein [Yarrowia lipolytica]RDW32902.1 major facilitator superfamily domain-containing protein [Yarrowia lipolytica]RDW47436.1 major facilitator superfamily domain-containing protein [Yarrowia lipolytica]RDW53735.1 major facilitator superfamily domain-containing protein [Yarrowia lipolytica]
MFGSLGILQPRDYGGEVTGTVVMMGHRDKESKLMTRNDGDGVGEDADAANATQGDSSDTTPSGVVTDPATVARAKASSESDSSDLKKTPGGIVLFPQPRNDPNDPLNWPIWRRDIALLVIGFHSFISGGQTPILASGFNIMAKEFDVTLNTLSYLVGAFMLAMAVGSAILAPTAVIYGKRMIYLISCLIFFGGAIWGGAAKSFGSLIGARIIMGIGASPTESLPSSSIAEIYFMHERAYRLGIYTLLMLGGKNIVPLVSAFIISAKGWNWVFWVLAIIVGMDFVLIFFFVPDTWFIRAPTPNKRSLEESMMAQEARANSLMSWNSRQSMRRDFLDEINVQEANEELREMEETAEKDAEKEAADKEAREDATNPTAPALTREVSFADESTAPPADEPEVELPIPEDGVLGSSTPPRPPMVKKHSILRDHDTPHDHHGPKHTSFAVEDQEEGDGDFPGFGPSTSAPGRPSYISRNLSYASHFSVASQDVPKKSYIQTLKPYIGRQSQDKLWMISLRPYVLYLYPPVMFSTLVYSMSVVWLIVVSETISHIFSSQPYNFPLTSVGLLYVSTFIGGCLGSAVAGKISDMFVRIMCRHNNGVYEPEFRLVMIVPVMITTSMGLMGYGWATHDGDHWAVVCIFLGLLGFGCSLGSTTAITYCVDSYKMFASEALVSLNVSKNVLGFVFSLFNTMAVESRGQKTVFLAYGGAQIFLCLFGIPLYIYGKRFRRWTDEMNLMKYLYVRTEDDADDADE